VPRVLADARPDMTDVRALAAFSYWAAQQQPPSPILLRQLEPICRCLEKHEALLPVRGAWLAWVSLARISGGDVLSLARARDRLLERLLGKGLSLDQDLPAFLRLAGQSGTVRTDSIMEWLLKQREPVRHWIRALHDHQPPDRSRQARYVLSTERMLGMQPPYGPVGEAYCTAAYADLILAWGLARLGAERDCCQLVKQARTILTTRDTVHRFLLEAYSHRIQQVLEGRPAEGPLPDHLLLQLKDLNELDRYKIDWLRQRSRILEPCEQIDPYRGDVQRQYFDDLNPLLARLGEVRDRNELAARIQQLLELAASGSHRAALPRVLRAALAQAPRVGETFALGLLDRVGKELESLADSSEEVPLLEKALVVAAHFEQPAHVQHLLISLQHLLDRLDRREGPRAFAALAESSFRGLRKLGMRDEVDRLLKHAAESILQGRDLANLRARQGVRMARVLPALLHVAAAWFYDGNDEQATAVLDEVRTLLFSNRLKPAEQTALARAYAVSLGQAPVSVALERIEELWKRLHKVHDALTTRSHFSLAQLEVVEAVVLGVVDASFTLGATVRRWLDEDEYLVRKRIHHDLRSVMT
jgi:hypothetical protein